MASKMLVALATLLCSASTQASRSDGGECLSNTALSYKNVSVPDLWHESKRCYEHDHKLDRERLGERAWERESFLMLMQHSPCVCVLQVSMGLVVSWISMATPCRLHSKKPCSVRHRLPTCVAPPTTDHARARAGAHTREISHATT